MTTPGWYPDGTGQTRYWDGSRWTEHLAAAQPAAAPTPPTPPSPTKRKRWPWIVAGAVVVVVIVAVAASTGGNKKSPSANGSSGTTGSVTTSAASVRPTSSAPVKLKYLPMGSTFADDDGDHDTASITLSDFKAAKPPDQFTQVDGNLYSVLVTVVGKTGSYSPNVLLFAARNAAGDEFDADLTGGQGELSSSSVAPGERLRGLVYFDIPKGKTMDYILLTYPLDGTHATWTTK